MFWLTEHLLKCTERPEDDYEHRRLQCIQEYIEKAFEDPKYVLTPIAGELCSRIVCGVPDQKKNAHTMDTMAARIGVES